MKKVSIMMLIALLSVWMGLVSLPAFASEAKADYSVEVKDENNLASSKYDFNTDGVGSAKTIFDKEEGSMRLQDFNAGGDSFVTYKSNRANEFKLSMYANINLQSPESYGSVKPAFDSSLFHIAIMINDETPYATNACPYTSNNTYFLFTFELLNGNPNLNLWMAEAWNKSGQTRYAVQGATGVNYNDGKYHWYEIEVRKEIQSGLTGKSIRMFFDGEKIIDYFKSDGETYTRSNEEYMDVNFSNIDGYFGFWAGSYFAVGENSDKTNCYIDIKKMQMTSYDNQEAEIFKKVVPPVFKVTNVIYSPEASYEIKNEIEIKLSDLFIYEGDQKLNYEITCEGKAIGSIHNGYFVWTPDKAGDYLIDVKATAGEEGSINYFTLTVVKGTDDVDTPKETGCNSVSGGIALGLLPMACLMFAKKTTKREKK